MSALKHEDSVSLVFTKIIDQMALGTEEEDTPEPTDRAYWEKRGSKISVLILDELFKKMKGFAANLSLKYNKHYVGISLDGSANNFVNFKLRKKYLLLDIRMDKEDEMAQRFENEGLDIVSYNRWGKYQLRITEDDLKNSEELLMEAIQQAYKRAVS
jgi:predicted transport protein